MPKTSDGAIILVGRETIEALGTGEPVKVDDDGKTLLLGADSYDYPYRRIDELERALARFADDDLWGHDGYWHQWHGSDDPKTFARSALHPTRESESKKDNT